MNRAFYFVLPFFLLLLIGLGIIAWGIVSVKPYWDLEKTRCTWNFSWDNGSEVRRGDVRFWIVENQGENLVGKVVFRTIFKQIPIPTGENRAGYTAEYWEMRVKWSKEGFEVLEKDNYCEEFWCFENMFSFSVGKLRDYEEVETPFGTLLCLKLGNLYVHSRYLIPVKFTLQSPRAEAVLTWSNLPLQVNMLPIYMGALMIVLSIISMTLSGVIYKAVRETR